MAEHQGQMFQSVSDELPSGGGRWVERLDANYAGHSQEARDPLTTLPPIEQERAFAEKTDIGRLYRSVGV